MKNKKKLQFGQSLLETIFAIGILLIVLAAILALVTSSVIGQKESESQIIANNLGREAIEAVRNIRDSNWLGNQQWDLGLVDPVTASGYTAARADISDTGSWQLSFFSDQEINNKDLLYVSPLGIYSHNPIGSEQSLFSRHLTLESICQGKDLAGNYLAEVIKRTCDQTELKVGIKVKAIVQWQERGRLRQVVLDDLIYEWK
ncbi:MAG: hypothetical protein WC508_02400 [Patescibacteria group bacterium]